jgi:hypothetical protein
MEYKIATAQNIPELERMVNDLMGEGWEPEGGACASPDGIFFQSMVFYEMNDVDDDDDDY